jgi:3-isopropylmalate dehydratase small subunit
LVPDNYQEIAMKVQGKAWKFGDDINTDEIIPARYLTTSDPEELAKHCMEDADPEFMKKISAGDIIVAGKNFGCGSSREHAPIAIKAARISCVIAPSFARIFYRNSINIGLPIVESDEAARDIAAGDEVEVDLEKGTIRNSTTGKVYQAKPFPPFMQDLIEKGGLMNKVKSELRNPRKF